MKIHSAVICKVCIYVYIHTRATRGMHVYIVSHNIMFLHNHNMEDGPAILLYIIPNV